MKINLPKKIDTFEKGALHPDYFFIEYDGWHFEAKSEKAVINSLLKYIFKELKEGVKMEERIKKIKKQFEDGEISETQMLDNIYSVERGE